jgi:hypothetical protein
MMTVIFLIKKYSGTPLPEEIPGKILAIVSVISMTQVFF